MRGNFTNHGHTLVPLINRIQIDEQTGCWNWKGSRSRYGYGYAWYKGKPVNAHRLAAHLWLRMPLDHSQWALHKCDNPSCFNPKHLFIGTQSDNMRDCANKGRHGMLKRTHCPKGHPYNEFNTRLYKRRRICKACKQESRKR